MATYISVTWTAGDTITEAKLDNMVANDQSEDAHAANGMIMNNNVAYKGKESGGTARELLKVDISNRLIIGSASLLGVSLQNGCHLYRVNYIAANGINAVIFDVAGDEVYDPLGMHSPTVNPTRITVPVTGIYRMEGFVRFADNATGYRLCTLGVNGVEINGAATAIDGSNRAYSSVYAVKSITAGQYVEFSIGQSSGGNMTCQYVGFSCELIGSV